MQTNRLHNTSMFVVESYLYGNSVYFSSDRIEIQPYFMFMCEHVPHLKIIRLNLMYLLWFCSL